jgi:hypothetical protein
VYQNRFKTLEARDLESGELVHIRTLLQRSDPVKAAFDPERWQEFKRDVRFFRERLGPLHAKLYADHGFNPTPVWALIGSALANLVPAGSHAGILALTWLDPLLLLGAFGVVLWAFGLEAMLLAVIHFCIVFGAGFGWTGGAFLRFVWFFGVVASFCLLARGRPALAGVLLGLAGALRIFPAFFLAGSAFRSLARLFRGRLPGRSDLCFVAGAALTGAALALAGSFRPTWWG